MKRSAWQVVHAHAVFQLEFVLSSRGAFVTEFVPREPTEFIGCICHRGHGDDDVEDLRVDRIRQGSSVCMCVCVPCAMHACV